MYNDGISARQISKTLGLHVDSVTRHLKSNGIKIKSNIKYSINEDFFKTIDNEKNAYWLGFLMADGYVAQIRKKKMDKKGTSLHSRLVVLLQNEDHNHLEKMLKDMSSTHLVKLRKRIVNEKEFLYSSVEIYNKKITSDLISLGCVQKKSLILSYPDIPASMHRHFIRGYFDGDGTVYITAKGRKEAKFCSASKQFMESIKEILSNYGIETGSISKGDRVWILGVRAKSLQNYFDFIYNDSKTYLDRKYVKSLQIF